jgi:hypothetical protein
MLKLYEIEEADEALIVPYSQTNSHWILTAEFPQLYISKYINK